MNYLNIREIIVLFFIIYIQVFGQEPLQCYQCHDLPECGLKQNSSYLSECDSKYNKSEACYEVIRGDTTIVRGCKSDPRYKYCKETPSNCVECTHNGCNNVLVTLKRPDISCHKCDSKIDPSCLWTREDKDVEHCQKLIPKYVRERCYTKRMDDGSFRRGCTMDDEICTPDDDINCLVCEYNGCNRDFVRAQECIQAVEDVNDYGKNDAEKLLQPELEDLKYQNNDVDQSLESNENYYGDILSSGVIYNDDVISENQFNSIQKRAKKAHMKYLCPSNEQYYYNRGCYVMRMDSKITWGCAVDLEPDVLNLCKRSDEYCKYCAEEECNDMTPPDPNNGNTAITIGIKKILVVLTFLHYIYLLF